MTDVWGRTVWGDGVNVGWYVSNRKKENRKR